MIYSFQMIFMRREQIMDNMIDLKTDNSISLIHYELQTPFVNLGEDLIFSFTLQNTSLVPVRLDIRYKLELPNGNGGWRRHSYKISNRKCPVGFLLYNRAHTISADSVPGSAMAPNLPLQDLSRDHTILLFREHTDAAPSALPCRLHILVNGQVLKTDSFNLCL